MRTRVLDSVVDVEALKAVFIPFNTDNNNLYDSLDDMQNAAEREIADMQKIAAIERLESA